MKTHREFKLQDEMRVNPLSGSRIQKHNAVALRSYEIMHKRANKIYLLLPHYMLIIEFLCRHKTEIFS